MEIFNRDICPSEQFIAAYPELEFFTCNPPIARAFAVADASAVFWKGWHSLAGTISLLCVAVMMFVLADRVTLATNGAPAWLLWVGELLGIVALVAQGAILVARLKERWILARFHAERLRCLKFQAFAFLALANNVDEAERNARAFTEEAIANLNQELMGGRAAMLQFSPLEYMRGMFAQLGRSHGQVFHRASLAYERLRLEVQLQHFESRAHHSREADRLPSAAADVAFGAGTVIAVAAIFTGGLTNSQTPLAPWLRFATLVLFVLSAVLAIYQRGAASKANAERDSRYAREIGRILSRQPPPSAAGFAETVREMETIAMQELEEYSRSAEMASYLF